MVGWIKRMWRQRTGPSSASRLRPEANMAMIEPQSRFRVPANVASESMGSELMIVHLGEGTTFRLNHTGKFVWELAGQRHCTKEMVECIRERYPTASNQLEHDVRAVLTELVRHRLLEPGVEQTA
ncbi:MAG: PqqD family protein [Gemmataceae bacterium]|nr:PqqD family protein [Gemmataceae bacterium]